jgi:hypothetical protein
VSNNRIRLARWDGEQRERVIRYLVSSHAYVPALLRTVRTVERDKGKYNSMHNNRMCSRDDGTLRSAIDKRLDFVSIYFNVDV